MSKYNLIGCDLNIDEPDIVFFQSIITGPLVWYGFLIGGAYVGLRGDELFNLAAIGCFSSVMTVGALLGVMVSIKLRNIRILEVFKNLGLLILCAPAAGFWIPIAPLVLVFAIIDEIITPWYKDKLRKIKS